jgi:hypothetical protein
VSETMVVQRGCYYEDLQIGVPYVLSPGRTVDDADNTAFSRLTMGMQNPHGRKPARRRCGDATGRPHALPGRGRA